LSAEDELLQLAQDRDGQMEAALGAMLIESPGMLVRQLRHDLSRQTERKRMKRADEKTPRLETIQNGVTELACEEAEFLSGALLSFKLQLDPEQRGWRVMSFEFHLRLPTERNINMVRIELNSEASHDPLKVPRCHLHVGDSQAHIPFPIMNPRLILSLICEHIEPDFGVSASQSRAGRKRRIRTS
jgi:hypothetical protein